MSFRRRGSLSFVRHGVPATNPWCSESRWDSFDVEWHLRPVFSYIRGHSTTSSTFRGTGSKRPHAFAFSVIRVRPRAILKSRFGLRREVCGRPIRGSSRHRRACTPVHGKESRAYPLITRDGPGPGTPAATGKSLGRAGNSKENPII